MGRITDFFGHQWQQDDAGRYSVILEIMLLILVGIRSLDALTSLFVAEFFSFAVSVLLILLFLVGFYGVCKRQHWLIFIYSGSMLVLLVLAFLGLVLFVIGLSEANRAEKNALLDNVPFGVFIFVAVLRTTATIIEAITVFYALLISRSLSGHDSWLEFCCINKTAKAEDSDDEDYDFARMEFDKDGNVVELQEKKSAAFTHNDPLQTPNYGSTVVFAKKQASDTMPLLHDYEPHDIEYQDFEGTGGSGGDDGSPRSPYQALHTK